MHDQWYDIGAMLSTPRWVLVMALAFPPMLQNSISLPLKGDLLLGTLVFPCAWVGTPFSKF